MVGSTFETKVNKEKYRGRNKVLCVQFVRLQNKVGQKEGRKVVFGSFVRPLCSAEMKYDKEMA